jgi:nicotinate-nucleotide adenylyltransferase
LRIALFGGTFDPIHSGHMRAARAAARKFHLDRILFVPSGNPPHKTRDHLTAFHHRHAMVALACSSDPRFVPSLLEAPTADRRPRYSINTVRAARRALRRNDELFFLLGADAFHDLPHWKQYRQLLNSANFIVVSRPGFSIREITKIVPPGLLLLRRPAAKAPPKAVLLKRTAMHVLEGLDVAIASRDIRQAIRAGRRVTGLIPPLVEEYIRKEGLYLPRSPGHESC